MKTVNNSVVQNIHSNDNSFHKGMRNFPFCIAIHASPKMWLWVKLATAKINEYPMGKSYIHP